MTSGRRCPCCEERIESYGCGCGPSPFGEAQRHWTLRTDDDLVIRLNDVRTAEDNDVADAPSPPTMIDSPPSRAR
jgi:hypothetical protein